MSPPPVAAATDVAGILVDLFAVLVAAKAGDELFKRLGQPAIVGEILAGVLVGPSVLGLVEPGEALEVFAELGVVFLLFWVGLETRVSELRAVGRTALLVGTLGVAVPLAGGLAVGAVRGDDIGTAVFIGAALVATSVGITSAVLIELGVLDRPASRTILGAAIVDDVLALLLVAVATGLAASGSVDLVSVGAILVLAVSFIAFFALGGTRLTRSRPQLLHAPRFSESPLLPAVILCLGLAALAAQIGLAAIIGAFLAGMIVAETREQSPIEREIAPLYAFFPPFFFAFIGIEVDLGALVDPGALLLLVAITAVAVATKFGGAYAGARGLGRKEASFVAIGMVPRGEVGIIVAGIGATAGVIDERLFAVIVGMSILTTLIVPPLLRRVGLDGGAHPPDSAR
ncbi:MAG TPA: cation:proton antiporter [Thermoleophilaceae bacterium]|nr:cation:proton antiporter [Thermoleophilaceae bacterium]